MTLSPIRASKEFLIAALCAAVVFSPNRTYAYLTSIFSITETFAVEIIELPEIEIVRDGSEVLIENTGMTECYVRASIDYPELLTGNAVFVGDDGWTDSHLNDTDDLGEYYYCTEPLDIGSYAGTFLTSASEDIEIYAECIPVGDNTDYESAWKEYFE